MKSLWKQRMKLASYFLHIQRAALLIGEALVRHYRRIAEETDFPIVLYNISFFVGYNISVDVVIEASKIENIMGIKDSIWVLLYYQQLIDLTPDDFNVMQDTKRHDIVIE